VSEREITGYLTDEALNPLIEIKDGDKVKYTPFDESDPSLRKVRIGAWRMFNKEFHGAGDLLQSELTTLSQWRIYAVMSNRLGFETGLIENNNFDPITAIDISKITGISKSMVFKTLKVLIGKGIIAKIMNGRDTRFYMNPYITCRGAWIPKYLEDLFIDTKWYEIYQNRLDLESRNKLKNNEKKKG